MNLSPQKTQILLALLGAVLFIPFLGNAHLFDWDEINFAEASREMLLTGNYSSVTIDFTPFWEKPPLFFWMQTFSMNFFGVNEFAARLPNAICGIITLILIYRAGSRWRNHKAGVIWALLYAGSILPHFYFKSGLIDPWFNLFIFLSAERFINAIKMPQYAVRSYAASGVFLGLAVMTKGPVAIIVMGMTFGIWWALNRFRLFFTVRHVLAFVLALLLCGSAWFITEIIAGRAHIVQDFIDYQIRLFQTQDAGHGGPFFYHWYVLLAGCFPASVFFVASVPTQIKGFRKQEVQQQWMMVLFWCVLLLFSIVKTKIVHYSSLCYFPLTAIAAMYAEKWLANPNRKLNVRVKAGMLLLGIPLALIFISFPFVEQFKQQAIEKNWIKDRFAIANLDASAHWYGFEWITGIVLLAGVLYFVFARHHRKGLIVIAVSTALAVNSATVFFTPNVEAYSQRAAIEFYKQHAGEKCLIYPLGFKSYAHLFYSMKPTGLPAYNRRVNEIFTENPGIPVYLVAKINKAHEVALLPVRELYRKNGFIFMQVMY